jgi:hypothetical protein
MHPTTTIPRPRGHQIGGALVIMLVTTVLSAWLGAPRPATTATVLASAAASAAGTLAMALYLVRWSPYPRWGFLGAAIVLAAAALGGPLVVRDPAKWTEGVRPLLWMQPWFVMIFGLTPPATRPRLCAVDTPWAGRVLIGTATLLALIAWVAATL